MSPGQIFDTKLGNVGRPVNKNFRIRFVAIATFQQPSFGVERRSETPIFGTLLFPIPVVIIKQVFIVLAS